MPEILRPLFARAPAKINLTLDVLGKRADGYHDLASVMQTIALYDTIALWPAPDHAITLTCTIPELQGDNNLVARAARLLMAETGSPQGARIELLKAIPAQGGLGGGSSDAAAVLRALNTWWNLGITQERLIALAAQLGSDVPFFILGGTALIEGRGEHVTPLPDLAPLWLIVAKPPVSIATPQVFHALTPEAYSDGGATRSLVAALRARQAPDLTEAALRNALEPGVLRDYPAVAATRAALLAAGAPVVRMSGSGPTLYAPFRSLAEALPVWHVVQATGITAWLTHTVAG